MQVVHVFAGADVQVMHVLVLQFFAEDSRCQGVDEQFGSTFLGTLEGIPVSEVQLLPSPPTPPFTSSLAQFLLLFCFSLTGGRHPARRSCLACPAHCWL